MPIIHKKENKNMEERKVIFIDDTKFIYQTNFSGDPDRDRFGSDTRKGNIIIPDINQAQELIDMGVNVRQTVPKPGEEDGFVTTYFANITANYESNWPPKIYLVTGDSEPRLLDENTVKLIDTCYVRNVNAVLNPYFNPNTGRCSLYIKTMYVEQDMDDDPYASRYQR